MLKPYGFNWESNNVLGKRVYKTVEHPETIKQQGVLPKTLYLCSIKHSHLTALINIDPQLNLDNKIQNKL